MSLPTDKEIDLLLVEIKNNCAKNNINLGWLTHSFYVANIARAIATKVNLDTNLAYTGGLFHDVGRCLQSSNCEPNLFHEVYGYKFMMEHGYPELARFCITHASINKEKILNYYRTNKDKFKKSDVEFFITTLSQMTFNEYDKIIQLSDNLAVKEGYVFLEQRIIDIIKRRGNAEYFIDYFDDIFNLKKYFENKIGQSIYKLIPDFIDKSLSFDYSGNLKK